MADNSSIAFQIYKTIEEKQNELIKKNAIKPEDIQELSEENFIDELQASVNFYAKNISNKSVISEIYKEILKQVDRISDISQISTASGIKLPEDIIREGVKLATERTRIEDANNYFENDNNNDKLISQFYEIESLEEKMKFYENLSEEEKNCVMEELYTSLFGKDAAKEILSQKDGENLENNEFFKSLSPEEQKKVRETRATNNPLSNYAETLGFDLNHILDNNLEFPITMALKRLNEIMERAEGIDEVSYERITDFLIKECKFSADEARKLILTYQKEYKKNAKFLLDDTIFKTHQSETAIQYKLEKDIIKEYMLDRGIAQKEEEYYSIFEPIVIRSYTSNGELDTAWLILQIEKEFRKRNIAINSIYDNNNMHAMKSELKDLLQQKNIPSIEQIKMKGEHFGSENSNDQLLKKIIDIPRAIEIEETKKSYEENLGNPFADVLKLENKQKDIAMLSDFSLDTISEMMTDMYGSEFYRSMLLQDPKDKDYSDGKKDSGKIKESKVDLFYGVEAEDLMLGEELPFDDKPQKTQFEDIPKKSTGVVAETIDFSAGIRSFGDGENKTITPSATIPDIRKLIEKQGHMEDIVATIGKISEIGKNGINSIEQEKNADGEKKDDQKTSAPSDEEKE